MAIAVGSTALALTVSTPAWSQTCTTAGDGTRIDCEGAFTDPLFISGDDLTVVLGDSEPTSVTVTNADYGVAALANGALDIVSSADISVDNAAGAYAFGIYAASAPGGALAIENSGDISTSAAYAVAIYALGDDVDVTNAGSLEAEGYLWAAGIETQASGTSTVSNSGSINASVSAYDTTGNIYGHATGIESIGGTGSAVDNSGDITVQGTYAKGVYAYASGADGVDIDNSGSIAVDGSTGYAWGIHAVTVAGEHDITIENSGDVSAIGFNGAFGITATAADVGSDIWVTNTGDIAVSTPTGNDYGPYVASGIDISAGGDAAIDNQGAVTVSANGAAYALAARSNAGDASVVNSGDVTLYGTRGTTIGVQAASGLGTAYVSNSGQVQVTNGLGTVGLYASSATGARIVNDGSVQVSEGKYAYGAVATSEVGSVSIVNNGDIALESLGGAKLISVLAASHEGNVSVSTTGTVSVADGNANLAIYAASSMGNVSVQNSGDVLLKGSPLTSGRNQGIVSGSIQGDALVDNSGTIHATDGKYNYGATAISTEGDTWASNSGAIILDHTNQGTKYSVATALSAKSTNGDAHATNSGLIYADNKYSIGVQAISQAGDVSAVNTATGSIEIKAIEIFEEPKPFEAGGVGAYGLIARTQGDGAQALLANYGDIDVYTTGYGASSTPKYPGGIGMIGDSPYGNVTAINAGSITARSLLGESVGIRASGETVGISNSGNIVVRVDASEVASQVLAGYDVYGEFASNGIGISGFSPAAEGTVDIVNTGSIDIGSVTGFALGIAADAASVDIANGADGVIEAVAHGDPIPSDLVGVLPNATGIFARSGTGSVTVANAGTVTAKAEGHDVVDDSGATLTATAFGALLTAYDSATLVNSGSITADGAQHAVAVSIDGVTTRVENAGTIRALIHGTGSAYAIRSGNGVDTIVNAGDIFGAISTSDGDDVIDNLAGGTIHLDNSSIQLGAGTANAFTNAGTLKISGDSLIHMSTGGQAPPQTLLASAAAPPVASAVPSLNSLPLVNSGTIDMTDGAADDSLLIVGDLGGNGGLDIDVDVPAGTADMLRVDGSIVAGTAQTVNATFHPSLLSAAQGGTWVFARVSGNSTADAFVGGQVIGYDASNFLDLGVNVSSLIDASNTSDDVFSIGVQVNGLNNAGSLAASVGSGAWSLMTSTIGTWRQRMGVVSATSPDHNVAPFIRVFSDEGDIAQEHEAFNFGQGGSFDFNQNNSGTEVGLNFEPAQGFNLGLMFGKARGKQTLSGDASGSDKIKADVYGVYGTWVGQNGWYLDGSYRAMRFDARIDADGGRQTTKGSAGAFNVETGYPFELGGGLRIEPQFQYTWTTVDSVYLQGAQTYLRTDDADFHRSRLGVAFWKPFDSGSGLTWTPYGALSAVRVDDGKTGYTVGDVFRGNTGIQGTGALAELGIGLRKAAFSGTLGGNWSDGGALDSFIGGQLVLRYDW